VLLNRQRELTYLDGRYARPGAEFAVLYGRRRVGKTTLVYEWCQGKPHLYFFAARLPGDVLLHEFSQAIARALEQPDKTFPDWNSAFLSLAELTRSQRFIVVIDEYPFGEARWRATNVTTEDLNALIEKSLLWLRGDTSRWDVHYAFLARSFGEIRIEGVDEEAVHLFTPSDVMAGGALRG
jgi:hypothetical protein